MKIAHDPEALADKISAINADITPENFRYYFRHKDESTESSPSGQHMGYYKVILSNDSLVDLHVAMLNIGLQTGQALEQWKKTISMMLEKETAPATHHSAV